VMVQDMRISSKAKGRTMDAEARFNQTGSRPRDPVIESIHGRCGVADQVRFPRFHTSPYAGPAGLDATRTRSRSGFRKLARERFGGSAPCSSPAAQRVLRFGP
jgi:hypothetical protein